ncbi:MAG: magnesium transporter CorA family protein [Chitinophagaceae bacterium]|nr:magnesium transporter CorA family protein [Polaromonas sp.]
MRVFNLSTANHGTPAIVETDSLPTALPEQGFVWIACARREFEVMQAHIQATLQQLCGTQLVDLHVADLLNNQLPSHYDYTSQYDILVFRRLAAGHTETDVGQPGQPLHARLKRSGPPVLKRIDTSPVGFAVFDQVLLTVHPADCVVREAYALRLLNASTVESRASGVKLPSSPADLMLRVVNQMVDGYLDLRRELTHQLDHWQTELLSPNARFNNWGAIMDARMALHQLDEICEDQRAAVQDWIDSVETWATPTTPTAQRERDLLSVRSRDVLEHIERVVHHVRRMEQSAETAVQMHFSAQSHRTNDIMRTLTAVTAIFLPLNLITGFFGMNFEHMPIIHSISGFWWTFGLMVLLVVVVLTMFLRKRYISRTER